MKSKKRKITSNEYSKVNFPFMNQIKKFRKTNPSKDQYDLLLSNIFRGKNKSEFNLISNELCIINLILSGLFKNYYIDSENLTNFFMETKIKDEILKDIIDVSNKNNTVDSDGESMFITNEDEIEISKGFKHFTGCIHSKNLKRSLFFNYSLTKNLSGLYITDGDDCAYVPLSTNKLERWNIYEGDIYGKFLRLALNLTFYMSAFPENVLNRPPDEVLDKLNKDNSKTISLSKDIADYLHENRDVSPHLRRGHFRYLASDRFKNKQFQTVFVKSSFVKGDAKTIIGEKEV